MTPMHKMNESVPVTDRAFRTQLHQRPAAVLSREAAAVRDTGVRREGGVASEAAVAPEAPTVRGPAPAVSPSGATSMTPTEYTLTCLATGETLTDSREPQRGEHPGSQFPLGNPHANRPAFLRTTYRTTRFAPDTNRDDLFRYASWLPVQTFPHGSGRPVTWRSDAFAEAIGARNLWITFSGWWPERGARIPTGTFKECEAYAVYGRMGAAATNHTLVVASAGNTARAFLRVASELDLPLVVVVPEPNLAQMWTVGARSASTTVVAVRGAVKPADYGDAIEAAALLTDQPGYCAEGGARNVARRDGMGTTFLSAVEAIGALPDHYVQAVGSGTGAIAAWEAAMRVRDGGDHGVRLPELHLAQNAPFTPLVDSWNARSRELIIPADEASREQVEQIGAKVLANRHPPWSPVGGLYDALEATNGTMYAVGNEEAARAGALFRTTEGIDASPAAQVACAALIAGLTAGTIDRQSTINLNITGGGWERARAELTTHPVIPDLIVEAGQHTGGELARLIADQRATAARDDSDNLEHTRYRQ